MKFLFTSLLLLTIFVGSISNRAYTQNLSSISSDGSSLTTSNSFVDVSGSSVTIDVTSVNKVLIVATFTGKTTTGSAIATYRIADNADNNINSGEIKRSHSGTYGIGSQVYIFDVNSFSGNRTYTFQHKTDAQTLETTVNLTAIENPIIIRKIAGNAYSKKNRSFCSKRLSSVFSGTWFRLSFR